MSTLVMKFGGTSVGSPEAISQAAQIVANTAPKWARTVVVVSAMSGVTNGLLQSAAFAQSGDEEAYTALVDQLRDRHRETIRILFPQNGERTPLLATIDRYIAELNAYCRSIHVLGEVTQRGLDTIVSLGERMNARIVAAVLRTLLLDSQALDATEIIITDDAFQNAMPLMGLTRTRIRERLSPLLEEGVIPVITGFIAANQNGIITTLGRGGSDYTAAILGDCLSPDFISI